MASIHKDVLIDSPAERVWDAVRDVGAVHTRVAPGFLTGCRMEEAPLARVVSFANGMEARELIGDIDDATRRLVWSVVGGRLSHRNASMQIVDEGAVGEGAIRTRVVWIADLLPNEFAPVIAVMIDQGLAAMKLTIEG